MKFITWLFNICNPVGRRQEALKKIWNEKTKLHLENIKMLEKFDGKAFDMPEYKTNEERILVLSRQAIDIESKGDYFYYPR